MDRPGARKGTAASPRNRRLRGERRGGKKSEPPRPVVEMLQRMFPASSGAPGKGGDGDRTNKPDVSGKPDAAGTPDKTDTAGKRDPDAAPAPARGLVARGGPQGVRATQRARPPAPGVL